MTERRRNPEERQKKQRVAVVVPLSTRPGLTEDEEISFRHLTHHLGAYDRYAAAPPGLEATLPFTDVYRFDPDCFGSAIAYRKLVTSREFYAAFEDYDYILIYHLDALVFSDELEEWCDLGYDYIGAPWLKSMFDPELGPEAGFERVGNSGFCLRNVASHLAVLDSDRYATDPEANWQRRFGDAPLHVRLLNLPRKYLLRIRALNNVRRELSNLDCNEDFFWSGRAPWFYPDFRVAPVEVGLRFSFEAAPRYCFERNDYELPFGCHAWTTYDREFWEPYLLTEENEKVRRVAG